MASPDKTTDDETCCSFRKGCEQSVDRGPTAKADQPFMQKMVDAIEERSGKATSPDSNMTVTGSFRQPWEK